MVSCSSSTRCCWRHCCWCPLHPSCTCKGGGMASRCWVCVWRVRKTLVITRCLGTSPGARSADTIITITTTMPHHPPSSSTKARPAKNVVPAADLEAYQDFLSALQLPDACKAILTELIHYPGCADPYRQSLPSPPSTSAAAAPPAQQQQHQSSITAFPFGVKNERKLPITTETITPQPPPDDGRAPLRYFADRLRQMGRMAEDQQWQHIRMLLVQQVMPVEEPSVNDNGLSVSIPNAEPPVDHHTAKWHERHNRQLKEQLTPAALGSPKSRGTSRMGSAQNSPMAMTPQSRGGRNRGSQIWHEQGAATLGLPTQHQEEQHATNSNQTTPSGSRRNTFNYQHQSLPQQFWSTPTSAMRTHAEHHISAHPPAPGHLKADPSDSEPSSDYAGPQIRVNSMDQVPDLAQHAAMSIR